MKFEIQTLLPFGFAVALAAAVSQPVAAAPKHLKTKSAAHTAASPADTTGAAASTATKEKSSLPKDLEEFLGPVPARFEQKFRKPARELKLAMEQLHHAEHKDAGLKKLQGLLSGEFAEHAGYELAAAYSAKKEFTKSNAQLDKLLRAFPGSIYGDRARDLLDKNECGQGLAAKGEEAIHLLERCLWRASWKSWSELDEQTDALYTQLKAAKDPLFEPFVAELIQALPSSAALRQKIAKEIPNDKLEELASPARFRTKTPAAAGVKPVNPDLELFDQGMKHVLNEEWSEANVIFRRFPAEFPQSEHWDRAQFWIARTEEKLGNKDEAKKRFEQILADSPFTYYGLQASIYLKKDWNAALAATATENVSAASAIKFSGTPTSRQALSLWRLRALLEAGAIDSAREEARFLFQLKPGGSTIGQDDARGALLMARLFGEAGHHMAAFSHAYAAFSFEPGLLSSDTASLVFPRAFTSDFQAAADKVGMNHWLLLSVAKQESAFLPNAVSRSDALGLLQLLLATAKEVVPGVSREELFEPAVNAKAGSLYLQKLLLRFDGNIALALAGYNAGPSRAAIWQKDLMESPLMKAGFDPDAFIDAIPYAETRKYVGNILRNFAWYRLLAKDGNPTSIQELMFQWQKPSATTVNLPPLPSLPGPAKP